MLRAAVLVLAAALLTGCTAGLPGGPGQERPPGGTPHPPLSNPQASGTTVNVTQRFVHEHVAFALFIGGERVLFNDTDYDLQNIGNVTAHLHVTERDGGSIVHVEGNFPGGVHNVTLATFFAIHGVRFTPGSLTLDTLDHHNGSSISDQGAQTWQVFAAVKNGNFSLASDGPTLRLADGLRVLVTYGDLTLAQLEEEEAAVPSPP